MRQSLFNGNATATDITMAGGWRFSVAAKIQGEPKTVKAEIELRAAP